MDNSDLFDIGEPMASEMPMEKVDLSEDLPVYGPENRPNEWKSVDEDDLGKQERKPDIWTNPSAQVASPEYGPEPKPLDWRSSSPLPPQRAPKVTRQNSMPIDFKFKRYVRVPRTVRTKKPPTPIWEHNPPPAGVAFGPEPKPSDWKSSSPPPQMIEEKPMTPPRRSPLRRQMSDVATLTDIESPVRPVLKNTPPRRKKSPPKVYLPPQPAETPETIPLDPDDEMYWRSSWQHKNGGNVEVSGLLAYTASDKSIPVEQVPSIPKCIYHPDCDGSCQ